MDTTAEESKSCELYEDTTEAVSSNEASLPNGFDDAHNVSQETIGGVINKQDATEMNQSTATLLSLSTALTPASSSEDILTYAVHNLLVDPPEYQALRGNSTPDIDSSNGNKDSHVVHETLSAQFDTAALNSERVKFILRDYTTMKEEYLDLQKEHQVMLEREKNMCDTLHTNSACEDEAVASLATLNCELRSQLDCLLREASENKLTIKRLNDENANYQEESMHLSAQLEVLAQGDGENQELKELRETCAELRESESEAKEKLKSHDSAAKRAISALQKEMAIRVDQVTSNLNDTIAEKQTLMTTVDRLETSLASIKKERASELKKSLENAKEIERLKASIREKTEHVSKGFAIVEEKEKDVEKIGVELQAKVEETESLSMKVKWAQNKLRQELENHKETKKQLSTMTSKYNEIKEEANQIRADCQEMIKKYQDSEEMKSNQLDIQLKERETSIKVKEHEIAVQDELQRKQTMELEALKIEHRKVMEENSQLKTELSKVCEKLASNVHVGEDMAKEITGYKSKIAKLEDRLQEYDGIKMDVQRFEEQVKNYKTSEESLKSQVQDLETVLQSTQQKEAELLSFSEKLAETNAAGQTQTSSLQSKLDQITEERMQFAKDLSDLTLSTTEEVSQLKRDITLKDTAVSDLECQLEEEKRTVAQLEISIQEMKEELRLLKKKHSATTKDFQRQLQQSKRKIDQIETTSLNASQENLSLKSRTSSNSSLEKIQNHSPELPSSPRLNQIDSMPVEYSIVQPARQGKKSSNGDSIEIDKTVLVDRICRLQKAHAKKNEKLDFLEEHVNTLVEELQKKTKILQYYFSREDSGSLVPDRYDKNKLDISKRGGIMASVYSSRPHDKDMTLDLSLQINTKLQTVLEDLVLKNMTLKENIDTLSMEIQRLQKDKS